MQGTNDQSPPESRQTREDAAAPSRIRTSLWFVVIVGGAFILGAALAVLGWAALTWRYLPLAFEGRKPRTVAVAAACIRWILGPGFVCNAGGGFGGSGGTLLCAALVWGVVLAAVAGLFLYLYLRRRSRRAGAG